MTVWAMLGVCTIYSKIRNNTGWPMLLAKWFAAYVCKTKELPNSRDISWRRCALEYLCQQCIGAWFMRSLWVLHKFGTYEPGKDHPSPVPWRTLPRVEDIPNHYTLFHLPFMYRREIYKCKFLAQGRTRQTCRKFSAAVGTAKTISSEFQPSRRYIS